MNESDLFPDLKGGDPHAPVAEVLAAGKLSPAEQMGKQVGRLTLYLENLAARGMTDVNAERELGKCLAVLATYTYSQLKPVDPKAPPILDKDAPLPTKDEMIKLLWNQAQHGRTATERASAAKQLSEVQGWTDSIGVMKLYVPPSREEMYQVAENNS